MGIRKLKKLLGLATSAFLLSLVACSDDNPSGSFYAPAYGDSSSSAAMSSSDNAGGSAANVSSSSSDAQTVSSSSQNVVESSSSEAANSSSSDVLSKNTAACMWRGVDGGKFVNTGFDPDGEFLAGTWFDRGDDDDGGVSYVRHGIECLNDGSDCDLAIVEYCGGYCGTIHLDQGIIDEFFAYAVFAVAGWDKVDGAWGEFRSGDISDWGGLCVTYASDDDMYLELGTSKKETYSIPLATSEEFVEKCVTWDEFNAGDNIKNISEIRFKAKSTEKKDVKFNIAAVGKYDVNGACDLTGYVKKMEYGDIVMRKAKSK